MACGLRTEHQDRETVVIVARLGMAFLQMPGPKKPTCHAKALAMRKKTCSTVAIRTGLGMDHQLRCVDVSGILGQQR